MNQNSKFDASDAAANTVTKTAHLNSNELIAKAHMQHAPANALHSRQHRNRHNQPSHPSGQLTTTKAKAKVVVQL